MFLFSAFGYKKLFEFLNNIFFIEKWWFVSPLFLYPKMPISSFLRLHNSLLRNIFSLLFVDILAAIENTCYFVACFLIV